MEITPLFLGKLSIFRAQPETESVKTKMATPSEEEVVQSMNSALDRVKYDIFNKTDNGHTLGDISRTITKLLSVCESVGALQARTYSSLSFTVKANDFN